MAYLVPWGTAASGRLLAAALREDLKVWSADKSFEQNGRKYPRGTLIFKVQENPPELHELMLKLAASSRAIVQATNTGWVEEGVNFGSRYVVPIRRPSIALAWDWPASASSTGHARFVLERQYGYPVTPIRTRLLVGARLDHFNVLILPSSSGYASVLGEGGLKKLKAWVTAGGTLIGLDGAVSCLADPKVGLLAISREDQPRAGEPPKKEPETPEDRVPGKLLAKEEDYQKAIQPDKELPHEVPGVLLKARLDRDHWITAGLGETVNALLRGRSIYTPIKLDKGVNAAVFLGPDQILASGYLWEENRKQLAYKPFLVVQPEGRGMVIGFTADPHFRAYMDGLGMLFVNAVFRGPAHVKPGADEAPKN